MVTFMDLCAIGLIGYFAVSAIDAWRGGFKHAEDMAMVAEELQEQVDEAFDRLETLNAELLAMRARLVRKDIGIE